MSANTAQPRDRPLFLPIIDPQPRPVRTRVTYFRLFGFVITAIMRHWRPGDCSRCRLCPNCRAYDDGCLMIFGRRIPKAVAPLVTSRGLTEVANNVATKNVC